MTYDQNRPLTKGNRLSKFDGMLILGDPCINNDGIEPKRAFFLKTQKKLKKGHLVIIVIVELIRSQKNSSESISQKICWIGK